VILVAVAALVCGCGGGGGTATPSTGVSGFVVDADSLQGIGNMVVTVGGASGISDADKGGAFFVPAAPGDGQVISVQPSTLFVLVPGPTAYVDVVQGQVTVLPGPLYIIDRNSLPPG
jgi:hypothetical protein